MELREIIKAGGNELDRKVDCPMYGGIKARLDYCVRCEDNIRFQDGKVECKYRKNNTERSDKVGLV